MTAGDLPNLLPLGLGLAAVAVVFARWAVEARRHGARLAAVPVRVHVNGIRGKSTVVRLLAGALRQAGWTVAAKTTGSAPRVIDPAGRDHPVPRTGAPTLLEQLDFFRHEVPAGADAAVVECMAIRPDYQRAAERRMVCSTLHLLTNVRRDHVEQLGRTLPAIARSLTAGFPRAGRILTAEAAPEPLGVLRTGADRLGSRLSPVAASTVTDREMADFGPFAFRDNVALALAAAEALGVDRATALAGMRAAPPDPGAARLVRHDRAGREVVWGDLFAVNDPESAVDTVERAVDWAGPDAATVLILNNRADRPLRARQFADLAARRLPRDAVVALGAHRRSVRERLLAGGVPADRVVAEGGGGPVDPAALVDTILQTVTARRVLLIGLVNIHTPAAEALRQHLGDTTAGEAAG
jgi:poly-gamma-glutamate synthase PgsB/CapB